MTLIIKELIIRGEVIDDRFPIEDRGIEEEKLQEYLFKLKKEIEDDCFDRIMEKLQNHSLR